MKKILVGILFLTLVIVLNSCRKEKDTNATVYVVNASDQPVVGATVHLHCPIGTCNKNGSTLSETMDVTGTTGSDGKAHFNFNEQYQLGQAGFAVLDVDVTMGTDVASGVIKIEEEVDNEQTIVCQTC